MVQFRRLSSAAICSLAICAFFPSLSEAKSHRGNSDAPQDGIEVVAHLPLAAGEVTHFVGTKHYRRDYLYAESGAANTVTLIDVTDLSRPAILSTLTPASGKANFVTATGTAALVSEGSAMPPASPKGQTFRIVSFARPQHPVVEQEFAHVSAFSRDESRGLIFLANPQGVWILHEKLAVDPEFEREWERMALDNR